jgi:hypothetical protein
MLAPHHKELLTAYIDGELSARQRRHVLRLLRRSGDARQLLQRLEQDSREIKALPVCVPPTDLSAPVLAAISQRKLKLVRRPQPLPSARFPIWTGVAAAASVLLLVGIGSFLHYSRGPARSDNSTAHHQAVPDDPSTPIVPAEKELVPGLKKKTDPKEDSAPPVRLPEEPENWDFLPSRSPGTKPVPPEKVPAPRSPSAPVLASGEKEAPGKLERVEIATPSLFRLDDLAQASSAGKLRERLAPPGAYRVELLCKDASRSFAGVRTAFIQSKIHLLVDSIARARLKKPLYHNHFAVFLENVTPDDVVKLLERLHTADRAPASDKKSAEPRLEGTIVVQEMSSWDRGELAKVLCVRELGAKSPALSRPSAIDIHKPLSESTEVEVASALEGKGVPRPLGERNAIFLSLSGSRSPTPELRRFMDLRKPYQPGTIQLFLVLRHVGP